MPLHVAPEFCVSVDGCRESPPRRGAVKKFARRGHRASNSARNSLRIIGGGVPSRRVSHKFRIFSQPQGWRAAPGWVGLRFVTSLKSPLSKGGAIFIACGAATRHEKLYCESIVSFKPS